MKKRGRENAVSPVVGVMLMLVVTIIIAAVVSGFSGGLIKTAPKAPQVSISAEAHEDAYITIDHNGGDPLDSGSITVRTFIPSGVFKDMSHQIDLHNAICVADNSSLIDSWGTAKTIQTGDKLWINWKDTFAESSYGGYVAPGCGEPVTIEVYDSSSGKMIATTQAIVVP